MTSCATCARALQPAWRFCIYCGTPTGSTAAGSTATEPEPDPEPEPKTDPEPDPEPELEPDPESEPEPEPDPAPPFRSRPLPSPINLDDDLTHFDKADTHDEADASADQSAEKSVEQPAEQPAASADPRTPDRAGVNVLAVIALALGLLLSPLAALFGHLALRQLRTSGEKGVIPARIAVVLGYLWLGAALVLGIVYLATNA
jgi:outer membrane biosynthesis protein TonB